MENDNKVLLNPCNKCGSLTDNSTFLKRCLCDDCAYLWLEHLEIIYKNFIQPERSKREDFVKGRHCGACYCGTFACDAQDGCPTKMRCSEHCGNTVRDK